MAVTADAAVKARIAEMKAAGMRDDEIAMVLMKSADEVTTEAEESALPATFQTWANTMPDTLFAQLRTWLARDTGSRDAQEKYRQFRLAAATGDKVATLKAMLQYVKSAKFMHGSVSI